MLTEGTTNLPLVADEKVVQRPPDLGFAQMIQPIKVSANLTREKLFEVGRKGPYYRYVKFPVEVTEEIKVAQPVAGWAREDG